MTLSEIPTSHLHRLIRRFYRGPHETMEDLAVDMWLLCFEKGLLPTSKMARNIVADHLRHLEVEERGTEKWLRNHPSHPDEGTDRELVCLLIDITDLTEEEKNILFLRYWKELSLHQISLLLGKEASPVLKGSLEKIHLAGLRKGWF